MEKSIETNGKTPSSETELRALMMELKADMEKKFVVTAKFIESAMDAIEKTSPAKKCEADIKGLKLLRGE